MSFLCFSVWKQFKNNTYYLLPNNKLFDMTKLKAFADDKLNVAKTTISLCDRVANTVGKEENAFSSFPTVFSKADFFRVINCGDYVVNPFPNHKILDSSKLKGVCRRQFWGWWKGEKVLIRGRKHCGKRRNCSFQAISPFPTVFSKDLCHRLVKARACLGKG